MEGSLAGLRDGDPLAVVDRIAFEQVGALQTLESSRSGLVRRVEAVREVRTGDLDIALESSLEREEFEHGEFVVPDGGLG